MISIWCYYLVSNKPGVEIIFQLIFSFLNLQSILFQKTFLKASANMYIKYGDMPYFVGAEDVLMKQKHRLIWERRNGKLPSELGLDL